MTLEMRKIIIYLFFLCFSLTLNAQISWNQRYQQYIDQYKDVAIEQMLKWKIPASITLAQGLFESGAGTSELTRKGNNHFGIKCHGWSGAGIYHDDDRRNECFRAYSSAYESFEDHSRFLSSGQRYKALFKLKQTDYKGWARGLKKAGYATNPQYANKLIEIIQLYRLYQYDKATGYDKVKFAHAKFAQGTLAQLHSVKMFNKNYYVIVRKGDSFQTLSRELGVSVRKLARYNERDRRDLLEEGEVIWLKKKQSRAPKNYKGRLHYVKAGESMYTIAQKYGIRLKSLYRMNKLKPTYEIQVGDALKLR